MSYDFIKKDLLDNPFNYCYFKYTGESFILSWEKSRRNIAITSSSNITVRNNDFTYKEGLLSTESIFSEIQNTVFEKKNDPSNDVRLLIFIKKYEVSKKIYEYYNNDLSPCKKSSYWNYNLYIKFSEFMSSGYSESGSLVFLNAFLKVNDALISIRSKLSVVQLSKLLSLIEKEKHYIAKLKLKLKVD